MKECTYGWYPPAKDIWKNYRATPDSYEKECLYKHGNSRYNSQPGVATPIVPTQIQLEIPSPAQRSHSPTRQHVLSAKPPRPPTACSNASSARFRPSPRKAWTSYVPQATGSMSPQPPTTKPAHHNTATPEPTTTTTTHRPHRVHSAHSHRPRISAKHRPIKSAGVARSQESPIHQYLKRSQSAESCRSRPKSSTRSVDREYQKKKTSSSKPGQRPSSSSSSSTCHGLKERAHSPHTSDYYHDEPERPESRGVDDESAELYMPAPPPSPPMHHQYMADVGLSGAGEGGTMTGEEQGGKNMYSVYENQLNEHGWRMQVHGDPLNLKAPCIAPRLSYTVEVPIPEVEKEGPKGHMVNYDTNFYNTIPRRRATFDVAQDWISEVLHAKRMDLQKRDGGIKYRYKNFSFVY